MIRLIGLVFTAAVLTASLGGQAMARPSESLLGSASPASGLVRFAPASTGNQSATSRSASSSATNQLSITSVFARNGNGATQKVFSRTTAIQYAFVVNNTGSALTALLQIEVFWSNIDNGGTQILDTEYQNVSIPAGTAGYYNPQTVPKTAVPGPYTILITLSYNTSAGISIAQGASTTGTPSVSGDDSIGGCAPGPVQGGGSLPSACGCLGQEKATCIPYWDQYAVYQTNSDDCGIASVAMALNYYGEGPAWAQTWAAGRKAGLTAIRAASGRPGNSLTAPENLEAAITHFKGSYKTVIPNYAATGPATLVGIASAIRARQPVIAIIDGSAIGRGATYGLHWVVVRGFTADANGATSVTIYDPDQNPRSGTYPNGAVAIPLATFSQAVMNALPTNSIVVTG